MPHANEKGAEFNLTNKALDVFKTIRDLMKENDIYIESGADMHFWVGDKCIGPSDYFDYGFLDSVLKNHNEPKQ